MSEFLYNLKKYLTFSGEEIRSMLYIILLYGFILGYNDGYVEFVASRWFFNLFSSILMAAIIIMTHELGRKVIAIKLGYTAEFRPNWILIGIAFFLGMLSKGNIALLLPATGVFITHHERMRIGKFFYGHHYFDNAFIALAGCYANIAVAMLLKTFSFLPNQEMIVLLMQLSIWYAIFNLLPFDIIFVLFRFEKADLRKHPAPLDGTYMLYASRVFYVFCIAAIVTTAMLLFNTGILISVILGIIIAIFTSIVYGIFRENLTGG
ncbi:MAG: hypothetical protein ACLFUO_03140 [Candidatus Woesearchaeota archaeon]